VDTKSDTATQAVQEKVPSFEILPQLSVQQAGSIAFDSTAGQLAYWDGFVWRYFETGVSPGSSTLVTQLAAPTNVALNSWQDITTWAIAPVGPFDVFPTIGSFDGTSYTVGEAGSYLISASGLGSPNTNPGAGEISSQFMRIVIFRTPLRRSPSGVVWTSSESALNLSPSSSVVALQELQVGDVVTIQMQIPTAPNLGSQLGVNANLATPQSSSLPNHFSVKRIP